MSLSRFTCTRIRVHVCTCFPTVNTSTHSNVVVRHTIHDTCYSCTGRRRIFRGRFAGRVTLFQRKNTCFEKHRNHITRTMANARILVICEKRFARKKDYELLEGGGGFRHCFAG